MKSIIISLLLLACILPAQAQDFGLYWKYKDYDGISLTVGRPVFDIASLFVKKEEGRDLIHRVQKVRVMVFEENSPITDRDMRRFDRKAKRRHLEDMVMVREGKTHVRVLAKSNRNALRKFVVFVRTPEESVFVSVKGKLRWSDFERVMEEYGGKALKNKKGKTLPPVLSKVPVSRV